MEIYPLSNHYYVNDVLTCQAIGNPVPDIQWSVNGVNITKSSSLVITGDMEGSATIKCTATNAVIGVFFIWLKTIVTLLVT